MATDGEAAVNKSLVDGIVHLARGRDDTLRGEGLEVRAEEDLHPELLFHIPREGYSSETITGVPGGLQEFLQPMISAGRCMSCGRSCDCLLWCIQCHVISHVMPKFSCACHVDSVLVYMQWYEYIHVHTVEPLYKDTPEIRTPL